jgi:DNA-binding transcriptional ArsR family regulator
VAINVAVIVLIVVVVGAFSAQLYEQTHFRYSYEYRHGVTVSSLAALNAVTINQYTLLAVTPSLSTATSVPSQSYLNNITRSEIYTYISQNPGAQFRAIAAALCLPLGLAEYHLAVLVKSGLVAYIRDGRYKRFFAAKRYTENQMQTISLLRHRTTRRILEALLKRRELSHSRLADEVAITSQALTWQMKTLRNTSFVLEVNVGLKTVYSIDQSAEPTLAKYLSLVG